MSIISILHYSSYPLIGGVERILQAHAKLFTKHGHKVNIITGEGEQFDEKIPVRVLPEMRSLHLVDSKLQEELGEGKVTKRFETLKDSIYGKLKAELSSTDICISHNLLTMHFNLALTSALVEIIEQKVCKKFISWSHDATFTDSNYRKQWRYIYPWSLLHCPASGVRQVTISGSRRKKLAAIFGMEPDEIAVIPDGISPEEFLNLSPITMRLYEKFRFADFDFLFFYPARIVRRKNIELAIRITKEVNVKGKASCLVVTGSPDPYNEDSILYYRSLKDLAKKLDVEDRVIFLCEERNRGRKIRVGNSLLRDFYLLSDLLLFTSKQEGFGIPVLEAGLSNLPVACSKIGPLKEVGGKDVLYLKPGDTTEVMADAIIRYLGKYPHLRLFKRVMRDYSWDKIFYLTKKVGVC